MRQHIDTAPVWDAYRQDCECPLCSLERRSEEGNVEYFLGESVMEPSQRIEVNQKGFCARHFKKMYDAGNRLGLGLITHTYLRETLRRYDAAAKQLRNAAEAEAGKSALKRIGRKGADMESQTQALSDLMTSCVMCERMKANMDRYTYTLLYMYEHEKEFPELFAASKGFCLEHFQMIMAEAPKVLSGKTLGDFCKTAIDNQQKNMERLEKEIEWFTLKFDYRNEDKPWGNSRDAVKRTINKLRKAAIEE